MYETLKRTIQPLINIYHLIKAFVANIFYGFPSRKLKVIGVTGTDGKTTTTFLIYEILKKAGKKVSMITSIYATVAGEEYDTGLHTTTPDATYVQKLLKKSRDYGDEYFVLETTSHALDQNRAFGVHFEIGVVTNITSEHLDYHKTRENYLKAKAKLLLQSKMGVINFDDISYKELAVILKEKGKKFTSYGLKGGDVRVNLKKKLDLPIADFNNYNYLAAYTSAKLLKIPEEKIAKALAEFRLPKGRLETVYDKEFKVIIDFAHTENSIEKALASIKSDLKKGRLIHVFGAAGLRDSFKRKGMGVASGSVSDVVILTEEDYRTEDPYKICEEIAVGLEETGFTKAVLSKSSVKKYEVIIDRNKAIQKALHIARSGDVVVLTGKSHEKSLARGGIEYPYSEEEEVKKALARA